LQDGGKLHQIASGCKFFF